MTGCDVYDLVLPIVVVAGVVTVVYIVSKRRSRALDRAFDTIDQLVRRLPPTTEAVPAGGVAPAVIASRKDGPP